MLKTVTAGQSLQTAIDQAQSGDVISVEAGATFLGPIQLPAKTGDQDIAIQSSRVSDLPQGRVGSAHSGLMPKILTRDATEVNDPRSIQTSAGAHHYKIDGIHVLPDVSAKIFYDLIRFGNARDEQKTLDSVPHHLKLDRCLAQGLPDSSFQRGLSLNSSDTEVTRCYFSEIHGRGMDAQAIASWNTPGRNKIIDTYAEASGENIMFGGSDPFSSDFIPSDTDLIRVHMFKPLSWKGQGWTIKNLLEFKNARRMRVLGCLLENNWAGEGQSGPCLLLTTRNQEGSAAFSIVNDILIENTIVKNSEGALNLQGQDNEKASQRGSQLTVRNCLFVDIKGTFLQINGFDDLTIERTTHLQTGNTIVVYGVGAPTIAVSQRFIYRDNVTQEHEYGIRDESGIAQGKEALDMWMPGHVFANSVMATPYTSNPLGNDYPPTLMIDPDYRTPYAGKGADIDQLMAAQSGSGPVPAPQPIPMPTPTPTPTPQPIGIPANSRVEVVSRVNVRESPSTSATVNFVAEIGMLGVTTGESQKDIWGDNVFSPVKFDNGSLGYCAVQFLKISTAPMPTPVPAPVPSPLPVPASAIRKVAWPTGTAKQNLMLDNQWKDRYRLKRHLSGAFVEFEKVV